MADPVWSLIVLAGGSSSRIGGADKAQLVFDGRTLLERICDDTPRGVQIVVAGPKRPVTREVCFASEDPPGGGPVAGLVAALAHADWERVAIVSVDMPWAAEAALRMVDLLADRRALVAKDQQGRRLLCPSAWQTHRLGEVLSPFGDGRDLPMRTVLEGVDTREWTPSASEPHLLRDVDTLDDLARIAAMRADDVR